MADSEKLINWLLDNASRLSLTATDMAWVHNWEMSGYTDLQVKIKIDGNTFIGRGTADTEELAFLKAGAEAIERAYCYGHRIHSTGVAAHTGARQAIRNAVNEFTERDAFFCHFFTKTSFIPVLDFRFSNLISKYRKVFEETRSRNIQLRIFAARSINFPVYLAVATGLDADKCFGGIIGLGSSAVDSEAINSAFLECVRSVANVVFNGVPDALTEKEFKLISNPNSVHRQRLALNPEYWKLTSKLFPDSNEFFFDWCDIKEEDTNCIVRKLNCPLEILRGAPIEVYRVQLKMAETDIPYPSESTDFTTTLQRLSSFSRKKVEISDLESRPHFLG